VRLLSRLIAGGIPAFFFFTYVLMLLWNSLIAGHLGWAPTLTYLQTAGLWFVVTIVLAWTGIASRRALRSHRAPHLSGIEDEIERQLEHAFSRDSRGEGRDDRGDAVERRIRHSLGRWAGAREDADWAEVGEQMEKKIRRRIADWID
jgi:hypothetical protein